jgi:hypothetical protein
VYTTTTDIHEQQSLALSVFPNQTYDLLIIQAGQLITETLPITLTDMKGVIVHESILKQGSSLAYADISMLYSGTYILTIGKGESSFTQLIHIIH